MEQETKDANEGVQKEGQGQGLVLGIIGLVFTGMRIGWTAFCTICGILAVLRALKGIFSFQYVFQVIIIACLLSLGLTFLYAKFRTPSNILIFNV
jgi:hypothetical protein